MSTHGVRAEHVTDAEFARLLDGVQPEDSVRVHLAGCEFCRIELETVGEALGSFRVLSMGWAETAAPRQVPLPARWLFGLRLQTSWGAGLAATAVTGLLAFWMGVPGQRDASGPHLSAAHTQAAVPSNSEMAADNRLLLSIDQELSEPGQPEVSAQELHLAAGQSVLPAERPAAD